MFTSFRLYEYVGNDVIKDDHAEEENQGKELKVSCQQSNDKPSDENLLSVEEKSFDLLSVRSVR